MGNISKRPCTIDSPSARSLITTASTTIRSPLKHSPLKASKRQRPALCSDAITGVSLSQSHLDVPLQDVSTVIDDCFGPSQDLATHIPCTPALPATFFPNTQSIDSDVRSLTPAALKKRAQRQKKTPEQRAAEKEKRRQQRQNKAAEKQAAENEKRRLQRQNESEKEKEARLQQIKEINAKKRSEESAEATNIRLQGMNEN